MIERKLCPDCGGNLGKSATKCRCGWQAQTHPEGATGYRPCQHKPQCLYPARMKVNEKWVCVVCYDDALRPAPIRVPGEDDEAAHA